MEGKIQEVNTASGDLWRTVHIRLPRQSVSVRYPVIRWSEAVEGSSFRWPRLGWGKRKVEIPGSAVDAASLVETVSKELEAAEREGFTLRETLPLTEWASMPRRRGFFQRVEHAQGVQSGGIMLLMRKREPVS